MSKKIILVGNLGRTSTEATDHPAMTVRRHNSISREHAGLLRNTLEAGAKALPVGERGAFLCEGWSRLKSHFKCSYRNIPAAGFDEALSLLQRFIAEREGAKTPAAIGCASPSRKKSSRTIFFNERAVCTTQMLTKAFACKEHQLWNSHRFDLGRFAAGEHFYRIDGEGLKKFKRAHPGHVSPSASKLNLWTLAGVARHAEALRSRGDKAAPAAFERLRRDYFDAGSENETMQPNTNYVRHELATLIEAANAIARALPVLAELFSRAEAAKEATHARRHHS